MFKRLTIFKDEAIDYLRTFQSLKPSPYLKTSIPIVFKEPRTYSNEWYLKTLQYSVPYLKASILMVFKDVSVFKGKVF